jgi:hypothetical protein
VARVGHPTFGTPASVCFSAPNDVCVPGSIVAVMACRHDRPYVTLFGSR